MNRLLLLSSALLLAACSGSTSTDLDAGPDASLDSGGGTDSGGVDGGTPDSGGGTDSGADSGGGPCDAGACAPGLACCGDACINEQNDPLNCGGCGTKCEGKTSMCLNGKCQAPTCKPACAGGDVCCEIQGPGPSGPPKCEPGPTCPVGCPLCN